MYITLYQLLSMRSNNYENGVACITFGRGDVFVQDVSTSVSWKEKSNGN